MLTKVLCIKCHMIRGSGIQDPQVAFTASSKSKDVIPSVLLVESVGIRDNWGSAAATAVLPVPSSILVPLCFFLAWSSCH